MRCKSHLPAGATLCALVIALVSFQQAAGQAHQEALAQQAAHQEAAVQVGKPVKRPHSRAPAGTEPRNSVQLNSKTLYDHRPSLCMTITSLYVAGDASHSSVFGIVAYWQIESFLLPC